MLLLLLACAPDPVAPGPVAPDPDSAPPGVLAPRPPNPDCLARTPPVDPEAAVALERAWPAVGFNQVTAALPVPGAPRRMAVVEQTGRVLAFDHDDEDTQTTTTLLDLTGRVATPNEAGLLGLAFHPDFADNGLAFVSFTEPRDDGGLRSVIARFHSPDGGAFDPASERTLLTLDQTGDNHNGGRLAFHPDGTLLIGFGDGGGPGRKVTAQDPGTWFGSFLRLDVDGGDPYAIPPDNPFADGAAPEVWAVGLRNPWGWDIDPVSGDLLVGDVGWDSFEEIDLVERGGNYGWPYYEGPACTVSDECFELGQVDPLHSYPHDPGNCVIGGLSYQGEALPGLRGHFLFTDLAHHALQALSIDARGQVQVSTLLADTGLRGATFGRDADGEALLAAFSRTGEGGLYRVVPAADAPADDPFPQTFSATGCADGTVPVQVNAPFWSDGADKQRWVALPDGQAATVDAAGRLVFPTGTVLGKRFERAGRPLETRLLMQREPGVWDGYAYVWDEDGAEARLAQGAVLLEGGAYRVPARHECGQCHVSGPLGMSLAQLAGTHLSPDGRPYDQLAELARVGVIEGLDAEDLATAPLPHPDGDARAWLHVNCAGCHQPEGAPGAGDMDLRFDTPLAEARACDAPPQGYDLGLEDARLIAPGDPGLSLVLARARATETLAMPPVGVMRPDAAGLAMVEAWILGLEDCVE